MTIVLPAQVYGKNCNNLYAWLIRSCEMKDKPVKEAVSFEWKAGNGDYPPVWALWVEPGQSWGLLYCFEDVGEEPGGSHRPHTLRKTVGLCTRADLPLISSLASGRQPQKHEVSDAGRWTLDFSVVDPPTAELWRSGILLKDDSANCSLRIKKLSPPAPCFPLNSPTGKPRPCKSGSGRLLPLLLIGAVGGAAGMHYVDKRSQDETITELRHDLDNKDEKIKELEDSNAEEKAKITTKFQKEIRERDEEIQNLNDQIKVLKKQAKGSKDQENNCMEDQNQPEPGGSPSFFDRLLNKKRSAGGADASDERP